MGKNDSKKLWLKLDEEIKSDTLLLGRYTTQAYTDDPFALAFITSRYKFWSFTVLRGPYHI